MAAATATVSDTVSILKKSIMKEGMMFKAASAKGKDQMRANWKDRWFVLKKNTLAYFKAKGETKEKGEIDLRAAKVELVEESVTKRPYGIRIVEAKQVFYYLCCSSGDEQKSWFRCIRIAAGFPDPDEVQKTKEIPIKQSLCYCTFGVLMHDGSVDGLNSERTAVIFDPQERMIRFIQQDKIFKQHEFINLIKVDHSPMSDIRVADTKGVRNLYSVTCDYGGTFKYKWFMGSLDEAKSVKHMLEYARDGNLSEIRRITDQKVSKSGPVQVSDSVQPGTYHNMYAHVLEKRVVLFDSSKSVHPNWALYINDYNCYKKDGTHSISLRTGVEECVLKFETTPIRDEWLTAFGEVCYSMKQKLEKEMADAKAAAAATAAAAAPKPAETATAAAPVSSELKFTSFIQAGGAADLKKGEDTFIVSWGLGKSGQLGHRSKDDALLPVIVEALRPKCVRYVDAGDGFAVAITDGGHVYVWGEGDEYQLGLGKANKQSSTPYLVTSLLKAPKGVAYVACGRAHVLAVSGTGVVYAWGAGDKGQLGNAKFESEPYPIAIPSLENKTTSFIAAGGNNSAAIVLTPTGKRELYLWGANEQGALGSGTLISSNIPLRNGPLSDSADPVTYVDIGWGFTAAVTDAGALWTFGCNSHGQLGHGDTKEQTLPKQVKYFVDKKVVVSQISLGENHVICVGKKGPDPSVYTWGAGIVNAFKENLAVPVLVDALGRSQFVNAGRAHSVSIDDKLHMFSFGLNENGELGNGVAHVQALVKVRLSQECQVLQAVCGKFWTLALIKGKPPAVLISASKTKEPEKKVAAPTIAYDTKTITNAANGGAGAITLDENTANAEIAKLLAAAGVNMSADGGISAASAPTEPPPPITAADAAAANAAAAAAAAGAGGASTTGASGNPADGGAAKIKKKKPLPEGWKKVKDPKTGRAYYYNKDTRATSWVRPKK